MIGLIGLFDFLGQIGNQTVQGLIGVSTSLLVQSRGKEIELGK